METQDRQLSGHAHLNTKELASSPSTPYADTEHQMQLDPDTSPEEPDRPNPPNAIQAITAYPPLLAAAPAKPLLAEDHEHSSYGANNDKDDQRIKMYEFKSTKKSVLLKIGAGTACAIVLMLGHHLFLSSLDGERVDNYSQFWIRNASNAFSQSVVIFIGFSAGPLMIQLVSYTLFYLITF